MELKYNWVNTEWIDGELLIVLNGIEMRYA